MGIYGKSAVLAFRIIGVMLSLYSVFAWGFYGIRWIAGLESRHYATGDIVGGVGFIFFGVLLCIVSGPLGRLVAKGLD